MPIVAWGGRLMLGWLFTEGLKSVADTATATSEGTANIAKIAPYALAGVALYFVLVARRG